MASVREYHDRTKHSVGQRALEPALSRLGQPAAAVQDLHDAGGDSAAADFGAPTAAGAGGHRGDAAAGAAPAAARPARAGAPAPLQRRHHPQEGVPGRAGDALPRRGVHRRALPHRPLPGVRRAARARRPASITSARTTSRCAGCAPATTARALVEATRRRARRSPPRRRCSCARRPSGATPGSTRRAPTGTASGTAARSSPTCSRWPRPTAFRARVVLGFVDAAVNGLLGLDPRARGGAVAGRAR